jgi:hypothetical protein
MQWLATTIQKCAQPSGAVPVAHGHTGLTSVTL